LAWQLCLCALAVIIALLHHAEPEPRRRLIDALFVVVALTAASYALAVSGGLDHAVVTYPHESPQPILR
jgi:anaerobic C4-dicarboxylate transporter